MPGPAGSRRWACIATASLQLDGRDIEAADDPKAREQELEAELRAYASPFRTAEALGIEEIIDPRATRSILCDFANLAAKRREPGRSTFGMRP